MPATYTYIIMFSHISMHAGPEEANLYCPGQPVMNEGYNFLGGSPVIQLTGA